MRQQRIQKIIAACGESSRRQAETLIEQGKVTVNNKPAVLGDKADHMDVIRIGSKIISRKNIPTRVIVLNKPSGYIAGRKDPQGRKTVFDLLPGPVSGRWVSVGRLDINTTGLLLFTTNGDLANQLMHPSANIEREYLCRVYGIVNDNIIKQLIDGVNLDYNKPAARFESIQKLNGSEKNVWFKVIITEGRYREVRRMWQAVNCKVSRLTRIRFANIKLPKTLLCSKYYELTNRQIDSLKMQVTVKS